jgi:hypothetical protein
LKAGVEPKRGGPKEETKPKDDVNEEFNNLVHEEKSKVNETANKFNEIKINNESSLPKEEAKNDYIDINRKLSPPKSITHDFPTENVSHYEIPKQEPRHEFKPDVFPEPKHEFKPEIRPEPKHEPKREFKPEPKPEVKNEVRPEIKVKPEVRNLNAINLKNSMLGDGYSIDNVHVYKKLDIKLPVKYKSVDYFKLLDNMKRILDHGGRELQSNKIEKTLEHAMLTLYYLHNIEK